MFSLMKYMPVLKQLENKFAKQKSQKIFST